MDDLISRQAAIDAAIEAADDWDGGCNIGRQKRIEKYIRQLPSAEPKRGKWIKKHRHYGGFRSYTGFDAMGEQHTITVDERTEYDDFYCSECGTTTITPDEAIKLLGLATKPRVTKEIELSVAPDVTDKFLEAINMAIEALKEPKIIRCKDCKNWDTTWTNDFSPNYHYCPMVDGVRKEDWFCADAERRTE